MRPAMVLLSWSAVALAQVQHIEWSDGPASHNRLHADTPCAIPSSFFFRQIGSFGQLTVQLTVGLDGIAHVSQ